jgi:putative nucleotidyltransferase-like protein
MPDGRRSAAARTLAVDRVTAEVVRALRASGVDPILLKGPALEAWTRADERPRTYVDTDLLVAPGALETTRDVLRSLGFDQRLSVDETPGGRATSMHWTRRADDAEVDLHVALTGVFVAPELLWAELDSRTVVLTVAGEAVRILAAPARALHVALHAAQHGPQFPGPLRDLRCAFELVEPSVWDEAAGLAERLDARSAFAAGLRLEPAGAAVAARLDLPRPSSPETVLRAQGPVPLALGIEAFRGSPGWRPKSRMLFDELTPSPEFMRLWSGLARRGRLGLVAAYVWRPIWLLALLPRALRAEARARREARQS